MVMVMRSISSCRTLSLPPPPPPPPPPRRRASNHLSTQKQLKRNSRNYCITRPQILPSSSSSSSSSSSRDALGFRVFVLSDLHTDYPENMNWVKSLSTKAYKNDLLLLAGDVAETYHNFYLTMSLLKDRFEHVVYVPGNHDLWCRSVPAGHPYYLDSLEKLNQLLDACRGLGVQTRPMVLFGLGIVPLFSWYHESFDREMDIASIRIPSLEMVCKDFHACKWPGELSNRDTSLALYFDAMNKENEDAIKLMKNTCTQIITFSHFLPRQELCPEKRMLFYPNLPKIVGSDFLEVRIRSIHGSEGNASACHVFGHTHFCWDSVLDGIRRASVDIFLKAAGYLDCAVRHVLPQFPTSLREDLPVDLAEGVLRALCLQALGQGVDIQLGMAIDSAKATLAVKRRLACEMVKCWQQAQDNIMNLPLANGWGGKHRLFIKWKYVEAKAAAYYYHGLILDEGNTEKSHGMAVAALQAADEYFKESKRSCEAFNAASPLSRNPPLWGSMKYLSEKIPKDTSSKVRINRDLYSHEKIMETAPTLPDFSLALKPDEFQLPPAVPSWNEENDGGGQASSNQL